MADNKKYEAEISITAKSDVKAGVDKAAKDLKKLHTATMKAASAELKTNKESKKLNDKEAQQRKKNSPQEIRELQTRNKLLAEEIKLLKEKAKLQKQAEAADRRRGPTTFFGGLAAGFGSQFRRGGRGGGAGGGGGGGGGPSTPFRARLGGAIGGAVGGGAVGLAGMGAQAIMALLSMPIQAIGNQYQAYHSYATNLSRLAGYGGAGAKPEDVISLRKGAAARLGFSAEESIAAMASTARATGSFGGAGSALTLSRLTGMDVGEVTSMFGTMRQAGNKGFEEGGAAYKQLVKAMSLGVFTGLEKARMPEFLEGVTSLTAASAAREAGDVSTTNFARLLATLGATKASGMQGARGVAVAKALEEGFTAPGGGEEGQAMMLSAMGFGSGASYYEAKRAMQLGTGEDPNFIKKAIQNVNRVYGGAGEEANLAIEAMLGGRLSLAQIEKVQESMAAGAPQEQIDQMIRDASQTEVDVLHEIRDLLSGGDARNDKLLAAARLNAERQNEQIDSGDELHEALEQIDKVFREYLQSTLPAIKTAVETMADILTRAEPYLIAAGHGSAALAQVMAGDAEPMMNLTNATGVGGRTDSGERRLAQRGIAAADDMGAAGFTAEEDRQIQKMLEDSTREGALGIYGVGPHRRRTMTREQAEARILAQRAAARHVYSSATENGPKLTVSPAEENMIRQLDATARAQGFADDASRVEGATDTAEEVRNLLLFMLRSQGFNMPPEFSTVLDRTGGAPQ